RCKFIGLIDGPGAERSGRLRQRAADAPMTAVEASRRVDRLVEGSEHQRKDDVERAMKAPDRIVERMRMLGDRRRHPGMRELQQQRASSAEKYGGFTIDSPHQRARTENALARARCFGANDCELALKIVRAHQL